MLPIGAQLPWHVGHHTTNCMSAKSWMHGVGPVVPIAPDPLWRFRAKTATTCRRCASHSATTAPPMRGQPQAALGQQETDLHQCLHGTCTSTHLQQSNVCPASLIHTISAIRCQHRCCVAEPITVLIEDMHSIYHTACPCPRAKHKTPGSETARRLYIP